MAASVQVALDVTPPEVTDLEVASSSGNYRLTMTIDADGQVTGGLISGQVATPSGVAALVDGPAPATPGWVPVTVAAVDDVGNTTVVTDTIWYTPPDVPSIARVFTSDYLRHYLTLRHYQAARVDLARSGA